MTKKELLEKIKVLLASRMCDKCRFYEQELDWFMHNVMDNRGPDMTANYHTHGLTQPARC